MKRVFTYAAAGFMALSIPVVALGAGGHGGMGGGAAMSGGMGGARPAPAMSGGPASHSAASTAGAGASASTGASSNTAAHSTGQPSQSCQAAANYPADTPGNSYNAPGSAFNPNGVADTRYAGTQPQNSRNPKSVSQYDVACTHQR
jgi:hypothetical protein